MKVKDLSGDGFEKKDARREDFETKTVSLERLSASEDGSFTGLAIPFNSLHDSSSWMLGDGWQDTVAATAFDETLAAHKSAGTMPILQWMHVRGNVIGTITSAKVTPEGVQVEGKISPRAVSPSGVPVLELVRTNAVGELSIGFQVTQASLDEKAKVRTIENLAWRELSVVDVAGAGPAARITDIKSDPRTLEAVLVGAGLSRREAKTLLAKGLSAVRAESEALGLTGAARKGLDSSAAADQSTADAHAASSAAMAAHAGAMAAHATAANDRTVAAQQAAAKGDPAAAAHDASAERHQQMASMHRDIHAALTSSGPVACAAASAGESKAQWTVAYIDNLPDSAFLHVEPGGKKDAEGKTTPRALRHLPFKDAAGAVDLPHLRNAAARIPQSSLPAGVKARLATKVSKMIEDAADGGKDDATEGPDGQQKSSKVTPNVQIPDSSESLSVLVDKIKDSLSPSDSDGKRRDGAQRGGSIWALTNDILDKLKR
jgi:HK97 family phage prohead protease